MAVWTDLSAAFGYGTKLTSTQMQQLRDNITALAEGASGAPSIENAAIGTNAISLVKMQDNSVDTDELVNSAVTSAKINGGAVTEGKLGASAVDRTALKTAQSSVSHSSSSGAEKTLPGGEYGFYPRISMDDTTSRAWRAQVVGLAGSFAGWTSYVTNIGLSSEDAAGTIYAQQRYVTSSGEVFWIFILREKQSKRVISVCVAPDHPCFGNGGNPEVVPHPFPGYDSSNEEILAIIPDKLLVKEIYSKATSDMNVIKVILKEYVIDDKIETKWPDIPVTVGLPDEWVTKYIGDKIKPIKMVIPQPDYIKTAGLKLK